MRVNFEFSDLKNVFFRVKFSFENLLLYLSLFAGVQIKFVVALLARGAIFVGGVAGKGRNIALKPHETGAVVNSCCLGVIRGQQCTGRPKASAPA